MCNLHTGPNGFFYIVQEDYTLDITAQRSASEKILNFAF
jgi:hypothetical protein